MSGGYKIRPALIGPFFACTLFASAQQLSNQVLPSATLDPDFKIAADAYDSGDFAAAATELKNLQKKTPGSFEPHELLGLTYAAQGKNEEAVEQFQISVQLRPDSVAAKTNLATGLVHLGRSKEAEAQCRQALHLQLNDYDANHDLAGIYLQENQITNALPFLEAAQRARPAAYDNGYDLALAYLLTGELSEAEHLTQSLLMRKDSGELHTLLGRAYEKQSKFVEAANEFGVAAHMDPSEDNLFVWASELLLHRTYVPSIEVFRQASQRYPGSPRLLIGLGMALYARGEYEKSIGSLLAAAALNPGDPRCYLFLSKAYLSSPNQAHDVIRCFHQYADMEPANALAQYYYAVSLWKGNRIDNPEVQYSVVESLLQKAVALDGTLVDAHLQLGILYSEQHAYEKALPEYRRASQLNPNLPDVHFRLGRYYLHAGEKEKAEGEFKLFKKLQAEHQADVDRERAEVQQFVVSTTTASSPQP